MPLLGARSSISCEHAVGGVAVEVAGRLVGEHAGRAAPASARAIATRWRSPPESCAGPVREPLGRDRPAPAPRRPRSRASGLAQAADAQRHRHVVERAELGQQVVELVDEAEMAVAPFALLGRAHGWRSRGPRAAPCRRSAPRARRAGAAGCSCPSPRRRRWRASRRAAPRGRRRAARATSSATSPLPSVKRLSQAAGHGGTIASLIAQRLGRLHAARAPARIERRDEGQQQRDQRRSARCRPPAGRSACG